MRVTGCLSLLLQAEVSSFVTLFKLLRFGAEESSFLLGSGISFPVVNYLVRWQQFVVNAGSVPLTSCLVPVTKSELA
jgi:hypothetical protein